MPQPCYVLCCAITAEDQFTGSFSCIHLIEGLQQLPAQGSISVSGQRLPFPLAFVRVISSWLKSDEDAPDMRFEVQNVLVPAGGDEQVLGATEFVFNENTHQRVLTAFALPALQPGTLYIESRIR